MPAAFAKDLCGFRAHGKPNTSDASDQFSVDLGQALFEALGVDPAATGLEPTGAPFSQRVADDLQQRIRRAGSPLLVVPEKPLNAFDQYSHVAALKGVSAGPSKQYQAAWNRLVSFTRKAVPESDKARRTKLEEHLARVSDAAQADANSRRVLFEQVGEESLLKLDVTAAMPGSGAPTLEVGLSLKWSLRTDRAQDCRSQGAKMSALRRGRMPHFAAVTMEPRPYMLNLLGGGSGEVDCVYHLDLPALTEAVEAACGDRPPRQAALQTFRRLVAQRRLRDYDELVTYMGSLRQ
ncbi:NgoMIV family type II restriction endonuclease [Nocardioides sp.]|uniref:NgoMIV family type II restriction endonuclease n=1 Tax=Nocardioides sp. TaxID=35761 RepID=UPI00271754EF|nr:NgoMIV family type II restriction endonuclease [Nocardioides sp.]MDO9455244.1 NgoMIV family type II restriction endonuclease [Nocardioides sp.]